MEMLDLADHTPDEFEGKLVIFNECEYVIGSCLGFGAQKITYKLINRQSGLCSLVIKFQRQLNRDESWLQTEVTVVALLRDQLPEIIPNSFVIQGHGHEFEIQDYVGPYEEETSQTAKIMIEAEEALNLGDYDKGVSLFNSVLAKNPYHTVAMTKLASIYTQREDYHVAFTLAAQALDIEPNLLLYHISYIEQALNNGAVNVALMQFETMKSMFPLNHRYDELGMDLYLMAGLPEEADTLLEELISIGIFEALDENPLIRNKTLNKKKKRKKWEKKIDAALAAKEQAFELFNAAIESDDFDHVLEMLEKAYSIYDKDPTLTINLGFILRRAGEFERATRLLLAAATIVPVDRKTVCWANAAFSEIQSSNFAEAYVLLEVVAKNLAIVYGKEELINPEALPGVGIFIDLEDDTLIEEPIESAGDLIDYAIEMFSKKENISDQVRNLAAMYRKAAEN